MESSLKLKKLMKSYFEELDGAARDPEQKVAWCTSVGPAELLRAFGYKVYFPENHGALIGVTRTANDYIPVATSHGYSAKICSYLTSDIGAHLCKSTPLSKAYGMDEVPKPDLLVASDNQCREVEEWFGYYAKHFDVPLFVLRSPKYLDGIHHHHIDALEAEMQHLIHQIETLLNTKLNLDQLRETVRLSSEATQYWKKVLISAQAKPAPLSFFDGTIHMGPIVLMRGTQACLEYYQFLAAELEAMIATPSITTFKEKHRLYWEGMPVWGKLRTLSNLFTQLNTTVVASTYCNSWIFDSMNAENPIRSMAQAYAEIFINRSESVKEDYLAQYCEAYDIDGIIYHDALTCPNNSNTHFGLAERLYKKNGIPYIVLDGDLNDLRCFSEEQSIIKIETFIEQLDQ